MQRVWIDAKPPKIKTFFLIRHGESKWNKAQSQIDIPGLLDRDHPLTELGIQQAESLNQKWKEHMRLTRYSAQHGSGCPATSSGSGTAVSNPGTPDKNAKSQSVASSPVASHNTCSKLFFSVLIRNIYI